MDYSKLPNALRLIYHEVKKGQPISAAQICIKNRILLRYVNSRLTELVNLNLISRTRVAKHFEYFVTDETVDVPLPDVRQKIRTVKGKKNTEFFGDGVTVIGNRTIHRCASCHPSKNLEKGQTARAIYNGFASCENF